MIGTVGPVRPRFMRCRVTPHLREANQQQAGYQQERQHLRPAAEVPVLPLLFFVLRFLQVFHSLIPLAICPSVKTEHERLYNGKFIIIS